MKILKTLKYSGKLRLKGEFDDLLHIGYDSIYPLAELLEDEIVKKFVSVRFWLSDKRCTKKEAKEGFIKRLQGYGDAEFRHNYSEYTGYLWTDQEIKVGGHDLLEILNNHVGKYCFLEIDVHDKIKK